jgi:AcrR family transcriptional regulator
MVLSLRRLGVKLTGMHRITMRRGTTAGRAKLSLSETQNGNGANPRRARDRVAKKQALIQAALGLFASKGYEVTTTREIAAAAGCAEGLIHRYFKGKAGLLTAMIENRISKEVRGFQPSTATCLELRG